MDKKKILNVRNVTIPQARSLLESLGEENLDQFQRRTLDFTSKFTKISYNPAKKLFKILKEEENLTDEIAAQIVNCMPKSIEELRIFLAGGRRIIETKKLESILNLLNEYRDNIKD